MTPQADSCTARQIQLVCMGISRALCSHCLNAVWGRLVADDLLAVYFIQRYNRQTWTTKLETVETTPTITHCFAITICTVLSVVKLRIFVECIRRMSDSGNYSVFLTNQELLRVSLPKSRIRQFIAILDLMAYTALISYCITANILKELRVCRHTIFCSTAPYNYNPVLSFYLYDPRMLYSTNQPESSSVAKIMITYDYIVSLSIQRYSQGALHKYSAPLSWYCAIP